jgi:hypothetical protein
MSQDCSDERKRKIRELTNSPEYVAFIKEWKAQLDFIKHGLCQIAGCSNYYGDKHRMKEKYIDEILPLWMVWGESTCGKYVDIADIHRDILTHVKKEEALEVIRLRNMLQTIIYKLIDDDYSRYRKIADMIRNKNPFLGDK